MFSLLTRSLNVSKYAIPRYWRAFSRSNRLFNLAKSRSDAWRVKMYSTIPAGVLMGTVACASGLPIESAVSIEAEEMYNDKTFSRYDLLQFLRTENQKHPEDIGIAWRLSRASYDVANLKATTSEERKELLYFAKGIIEKAVQLAEDNPQVHNWYGIILSSVGDYEGSKSSIANSYKIKQHWEKSLQLDPNRSTTYHLLGRWCMAITDLSWLERKAAAVLFGTPPTSSYHEALQYLLKCEKIAPGTWKKNAFLIAQVYLKQNDRIKAKEWAEKALTVPIETEEDETIHEEIVRMLSKL
uniref:Regulator of microtubule dynamics protein 1 n=1 Tax=Albugo laibachii Nc14 TaxID=890382 RepID=F0WCB4_9STRA|nr:regulator of microtubule dynamics protein putative [Albugo laibachii Nc14]|eukprot:CCA18829.1 regulator of microtubule dynamics protein putative [Albugo laibachii Nc14]